MVERVDPLPSTNRKACQGSRLQPLDGDHVAFMATAAISASSGSPFLSVPFGSRGAVTLAQELQWHLRHQSLRWVEAARLFCRSWSRQKEHLTSRATLSSSPTCPQSHNPRCAGRVQGLERGFSRCLDSQALGGSSVAGRREEARSWGWLLISGGGVIAQRGPSVTQPHCLKGAFPPQKCSVFIRKSEQM